MLLEIIGFIGLLVLGAYLLRAGYVLNAMIYVFGGASVTERIIGVLIPLGGAACWYFAYIYSPFTIVTNQAVGA